MARMITECRICGNSDLIPIIDLGKQALTGVFPRNGEERLTVGPLELVKCHGSDRNAHCGLLQLRHSYDPAELYGQNYGYRSGLNRSMIEHLHQKVDSLRRIIEPAKGDLVLDIGSNDGTLLSYYPQEKLILVGIDPSAEKFRRFYRRDINLIVDFFSAKVFNAAFAGRKAKIITSVAMFYDLENPLEFMREIAGVLAEDGVWHFEQSYMPVMLTQCAYDTICHEHLEYYGLRQILWMTRAAGLKIIDLTLTDVNGGSFAVTVSKQSAAHPEAGCTLRNVLAGETAQGIEGLAPYRRFHDDVFRHREKLLEALGDCARDGKAVLGYGASTKGNVILQFCGLTTKDLPAIAEVNDDKYGRVTPGTNIPIISEAEAHGRNPDTLLVLPWHFRQNLLKREADFLKKGGEMLFPLPQIEFVRDSGAAIKPPTHLSHL